MLIIACDTHRAHRALEFADGELGPSAESPERADMIASALAAAGHERVEPDEPDFDLLDRVRF